ncbi:MAG: molybdenum cofactor biosynthesis protein [Solirubrobacterales bacterium]|nr:molybdenum cofactor biosynthesis protein [Solirubrobacterales bacterium]
MSEGRAGDASDGRAAVITISTSASRGDREDTGGPALESFARGLGVEVVGREVIPDERELIEGRLRWWCDEGGCELLLTTGGTGFGRYDVTPEATRAVIDREAPGLAEAMRAASREHTRHWMLSRAVAGIRERTVIVNFPGNPASIEQAGAAIAGALPHALALLAGRPTRH